MPRRIEEKYRRINILIKDSQYQRAQEEGVNLSGFIRDLLDDRFSHRRVVLAVEPETRVIYDRAISNFGATDAELEQCLLRALDELLRNKAHEIGELRNSLKKHES